MKKKATLAIALMAAASAFAQPEAGTFSLTPKVGFNGTSVTGGHYEGDDFDLLGKKSSNGTAYKAGFVAGVEAGYQVSDKFAVSAGILYSQQGVQRGNSESMAGGQISSLPLGANFADDSKLNLDYINIPILANYYLFKGFAVKAGIQPGFLVSAKSKLDITDVYNGTTGTNEKHETNDVKSAYNSFDFSIPVGVSYEFSNIVVDARYNIGVTDVAKSKYVKAENAKNGKNSVFQITVGYKFNL